MAKDSFVFRKEWRDAISGLPSEVRLEVYEAVIEYGLTGKLPDLKPMAMLAFNFVRESIEKNKSISAVRSAAGKKHKGNQYTRKKELEQNGTKWNKMEQSGTKESPLSSPLEEISPITPKEELPPIIPQESLHCFTDVKQQAPRVALGNRTKKDILDERKAQPPISSQEQSELDLFDAVHPVKNKFPTQAAMSVFLSVYGKKFGVEAARMYDLNPIEWAQMLNLQKRIMSTINKRDPNEVVTEKKLLDSLRSFLECIEDNWILNNFTVATIVNKYNTILQQYQNRKNGRNRSAQERDRRSTDSGLYASDEERAKGF